MTTPPTRRRPLSTSRSAARALALLATGTLALGALAACGGEAAPQAGPSVAPTATAEPLPPSPITGRPMKGKGGAVIAVKIDNTAPALPHLGLTEADLVYVEQVEGGLTRLAAIYSSKLPEQIAPVRSARETDAELLRTYGRIPLAFSGSVPAVHTVLATAGLIDVSEDLGGRGYSRLTTRYAPYDLAGDPEVLLERAKALGPVVRPRDIGFTFGELPAKGGKPAESITAHFPGAAIGFDHDEETNRWVYRLNGRLDQVPGEEPQSASTVIVQYVDIGWAGRGDRTGSRVPFAHSIGSGKAMVARDGKVFTVKWSRPAASAPTTWTYKGEDFPMAAGRIWVVLAPSTSTATVKAPPSPTATATATATAQEPSTSARS